MASQQRASIVVDLNAVITTVTDEVPRVLTVVRTRRSLGLPPGDEKSARSAAERVDALPFGPLDPAGDRTLELGLRGWVHEQTGLDLGYVEQLYTFGDRQRGPRPGSGAPQVISIAYLALVREGPSVGSEARWQPWYSFLPWEDWREGKPPLLERVLVPALEAWIESAEGSGRRRRRERVDIAFGLGGAPWDGDRVLDRYELLYEVALVQEAHRDRGESGTEKRSDTGPHEELQEAQGRPLALDHRRILATALGRLRGKLRYRPVVFELMPPTFTLFRLQRTVEALAGVRLHKQNFRRLVEKGGLVEGTGKQDAQTGGRPAELFRFRREALRERPAPGVGLPAARQAG